MRPWKLKVNLYDVWHRYDDRGEDVDLTTEQVTDIAQTCADRLTSSGWLELVAEDEYRRETLESLFEVLRGCDTVVDLNETMSFVWDEADEDRVWVNAVFEPREEATS